jgi:hypothetical protein
LVIFLSSTTGLTLVLHTNPAELIAATVDSEIDASASTPSSVTFPFARIAKKRAARADDIMGVLNNLVGWCHCLAQVA